MLKPLQFWNFIYIREYPVTLFFHSELFWNLSEKEEILPIPRFIKF